MMGSGAITKALAHRGFTPTVIQKPLVPEVPYGVSGWYVEAKSHDDEIILTAPTVREIIKLIAAY